MDQNEKAKRFAELHVKGNPLLLYNAWDAGSAKAILGAGAKAIATSSWSVAETQGYRDGEAIPIGLVEQIVARIAATIDAPVTVDFEGGYSEDDSELADNVSRLLDMGVIGINFEDRVVKGAGLYDKDRQARRISAIARRPSRSASASSSTRGLMCSSNIAITRRRLSARLSTGPKPTRPQGHPATSSLGWWTIR
jgi:2-methylisocitrate lyase-like PEP mutase family enzyme